MPREYVEISFVTFTWDGVQRSLDCDDARRLAASLNDQTIRHGERAGYFLALRIDAMLTEALRFQADTAAAQLGETRRVALQVTERERELMSSILEDWDLKHALTHSTRSLQLALAGGREPGERDFVA